MQLTSRHWTIIFVVVIVLAILLFFFYLYGSTNIKPLSIEEIVEATRATQKKEISQEERERIVRSTAAQPAINTMSDIERERIIRATTARPKEQSTR